MIDYGTLGAKVAARIKKPKKKDYSGTIDKLPTTIGGADTQFLEKITTPQSPIQQNASMNVNASKEASKPTAPSVNPTIPEYFKDSKTGELSGVTLPSGKTFLGERGDISGIINRYQERTTPMPGTQPVGTTQRAVDTQFQNAQLMQQAQSGLLSPEQLQQVQGANPDYGQAVGAGFAGVLPGLLGGAATGAVAGAVGGLGIGAIPGAIIGGIAGGLSTFLIGARSSIKQQQSEQFAADKAALTKGQRYLRSLITDTNQNPQNAPENIALFYKTLNMIDMAHAKTYKDSQEDLNKFLGNDGTTELANFEVFDNTMRQYYTAQFEAALMQPDNTRVIITSEDLENAD